MAIEPISSAMTYNAQPIQQAMQAKPVVEKPVAEFTEGAAQEMASQPVDNVTLSVNNVQPKDGDSNGNPSPQQNQEPSVSQERVKKAIEEINKKAANSEALFGIHEGTNRVTIKIVDRETKEVIKELPPEKTLDMIARIWDMAGLLVDEKR